MLDISRILESIIGLTAASILVKLLDKLIEKMCEYHDCRTLEDHEDEESANKNINDLTSSHYNPNHVMFLQKNLHVNISATNSATT